MADPNNQQKNPWPLVHKLMGQANQNNYRKSTLDITRRSLNSVLVPYRTKKKKQKPPSAPAFLSPVHGDYTRASAVSGLNVRNSPTDLDDMTSDFDDQTSQSQSSMSNNRKSKANQRDINGRKSGTFGQHVAEFGSGQSELIEKAGLDDSDKIDSLPYNESPNQVFQGSSFDKMDARNYNDVLASDDNISNGGNDLHVSETLDVEIKDVMRSSHF